MRRVMPSSHNLWPALRGAQITRPSVASPTQGNAESHCSTLQERLEATQLTRFLPHKVPFRTANYRRRSICQLTLSYRLLPSFGRIFVGELPHEWETFLVANGRRGCHIGRMAHGRPEAELEISFKIRLLKSSKVDRPVAPRA